MEDFVINTNVLNRKKKTVVGIIEKYQRIEGISDNELAVKAHVSIATFYNRKRNPENLSLMEWWRICNALNIKEHDRQEVM